MNAKEYKQIEIAFIAKYAHHWIATEFQKDLKEVSIAYHQVKSEEEAGERYAKACVKLRDSRMGIRLTEEEEKALRLAAFGKEEER